MKEVRQNKEYREIVDVIISEGGEMKVKDITACFSDVMATHVILLLAVQLVVLSEATIFIKPFPPNAL